MSESSKSVGVNGSDETTNKTYNNQMIRIGIATVWCAIFANFVPAVYLWLVGGVMIDLSAIMSIWSIAAVTYGLSWVIQPITYYPMVGVAGSYVGWVCGSVADIRGPSANMAQKAAGVESGTPQGDIISTVGITCSVFVSVFIITVFTFIGASIIPQLPTYITGAFRFILPSVFGAVFVDLASKNLRIGLGIIAISVLLVWGVAFFGIPSAFTILLVIIGSMLVARVVFVSDKKKA